MYRGKTLSPIERWDETIVNTLIENNRRVESVITFQVQFYTLLLNFFMILGREIKEFNQAMR